MVTSADLAAPSVYGACHGPDSSDWVAGTGLAHLVGLIRSLSAIAPQCRKVA